VTEDWIVSRTGIRERRRVEPHERLSDYAARAGAKALERAGVDPLELDLVLVATLSQDELTPNTAPIVAHALGAERAGAIDIGAACTSFLSGLALASAQIECGRAERILLIGADFITRITNYEDRKSAPLFGDAAGAAVLGARS
jgi:3-oxoacyl-[acyl-carrier-protein] synthase-3